MKKFLLFIVAISTFGFVIANNYDAKKDNNKETTVIKESSIESIEAHTHLGNIGYFEVDMDKVTFPWTISVPAPPIDVVDFDGPCGANAGIMTVSNGILSITFQNNAGILDLYEFIRNFEIRIRTHDFDYYTITIKTI